MWKTKTFLGFSLAVAIGVVLGLGAFTFGYAEGWSYLSTDPSACNNCHIMNAQYDSWLKSGHHHVAGCSDCHLPHAFVPKWVAKARNGFNHSWAFTFQNFPEPIRITPANSDILQESCVQCHGALVDPLIHSAQAVEGEVRCVQCHADVGHGDRAGLGR